MIRVPEYEIIAFLEWANNPTNEIENIDMRNLAEEYISKLDRINNYNDNIRLILSVFESKLSNEGEDLIQNIIHVLRCDRCFRAFLMDSIIFDNIKVSNHLQIFIKFVNTRTCLKTIQL